MIKKAYAILFSTYPNAQSKDVETLKTWFTSHTSVGVPSVRNMAQTFMALCALADFNGGNTIESVEGEADEGEKSSENRRPKTRRQLDAQVAFNIQVQIPGEQTPEVYEAIFRNLGKYVLGIVDNE